VFYGPMPATAPLPPPVSLRAEMQALRQSEDEEAPLRGDVWDDGLDSGRAAVLSARRLLIRRSAQLVGLILGLALAAVLVLHARMGHRGAAAAKQASAVSLQEGGGQQQGCLCIFDVDRTLTGKQGDTDQCPPNQVIPNVEDSAYGGGQLTLSDLAQHLEETFCSSCYLGIISAGSAGGPAEKDVLQGIMAKGVTGAKGVPPFWSGPDEITSSLIIGCPDANKGRCAKGVVGWYAQQNIIIPPEEVYFFDDHVGNTASFAPHGYNARQISCSSRDWTVGNGLVGLCGASITEVVQSKGIVNC